MAFSCLVYLREIKIHCLFWGFLFPYQAIFSKQHSPGLEETGTSAARAGETLALRQFLRREKSQEFGYFSPVVPAVSHTLVFLCHQLLFPFDNGMEEAAMLVL